MCIESGSYVGGHTQAAEAARPSSTQAPHHQGWLLGQDTADGEVFVLPMPGSPGATPRAAPKCFWLLGYIHWKVGGLERPGQVPYLTLYPTQGITFATTKVEMTKEDKKLDKVPPARFILPITVSLEMGVPYGMNHPPHCCPSCLWGGLKGHPVPIAPKLPTQETPIQEHRGVSTIQHAPALAALKSFSALCPDLVSDSPWPTNRAFLPKVAPPLTLT